MGEVGVLLEQSLDQEGKVDTVTFKLAKDLKHKLVECEVKGNENAVIMAAFRQKKKRSRARINTHEGRLLNKENLDEIEAEEAQAKNIKEQSKREKQFQAECKSLWKLTALFTSSQRRRNKNNSTRPVNRNISTPSTIGSQASAIFLLNSSQLQNVPSSDGSNSRLESPSKFPITKISCASSIKSKNSKIR